MQDSSSGKRIAVLLLLGVVLIGVIAAVSTGGDSTESADGAGDITEAEAVEADAVEAEAVEAEVAGEVVVEDPAPTDEASETEAAETEPEDTEADDAVSEATTSTTSTTTTSTTSTTTTSTTSTTTTTTTVAPAASTTSATTATTAAPTTTAPAPTPGAAPRISVATIPTTTIPTGESEDASDEASADEDPIAEEGEVEAVEDFAIFPGGSFPGQVVFFDGQFIRLDSESGADETGEFSSVLVASSPDGTTWTTAPTTGLPDHGFVQSMVATDDTLLAIVEIFPDYVDPYSVLIDSGLLTNAQVDSLCDIIFDGPGDPIIVTTCDFEAADQAFADFEEALANAETDAERIQIEEEFFERESEFYEGVEILRLDPDNDYYDDIVTAFLAEEEAFSQGPEQVVATSADGVSWTTAELPEMPADEGGFAFITSAATSGDRVAILVSVEPAFSDPFQIIIESGLLPEEELENLCGIESGEFGDPIILTACDFAATDDEVFDEVEILRIEQGDDLYDLLFEAFGSEPEANPVVVTGSIGGDFAVVELPVEGFPNSIAGTDAGFLISLFSFDGGPTVMSSTDGLTWTPVEAFGSGDNDSGDVQVAGTSEAAVAVVVTFDDPSGQSSTPIVLMTTDLGDTFTESTIPTELFGAFPFPVAGPAGFAALLEGTTEPFEFFGPEVVDVEQGDFIMEVRLNEDFGGLRSADGTVIHENVLFEEAFTNGEIPNVLRIDPETEDAIWLDPETGEVLVIFLVDDIISAIDESFAQFDEPEFQPDFVSELWFSPDGETWTLLDEFTTNDDYVSIAAIGDDEVLLRVESFATPPDELFIFEEEEREPTEEELAALDEFFAQEQGFEWVRVPVS